MQIKIVNLTVTKSVMINSEYNMYMSQKSMWKSGAPKLISKINLETSSNCVIIYYEIASVLPFVNHLHFDIFYLLASKFPIFWVFI